MWYGNQINIYDPDLALYMLKSACYITDREVLPYLLGIYTSPALNITPQFDASVLEYFATVPYETILVKIWGIAQNCDCEARLEDKYGLSR